MQQKVADRNPEAWARAYPELFDDFNKPPTMEVPPKVRTQFARAKAKVRRTKA